jgi:hypothetical protein
MDHTTILIMEPKFRVRALGDLYIYLISIYISPQVGDFFETLTEIELTINIFFGFSVFRRQVFLEKQVPSIALKAKMSLQIKHLL